jgi:HD-like signal output (HDOD) protein
VDPAEVAAAVIIDRSGALARTQVIPALQRQRGNIERSFEPIVRQISAYAPLSNRILHLANSAWFGGGMKVQTVEEAFRRLGVNDFCKAALAGALRYGLTHPARADDEAWWQHSETVAHLGEMVSQHLQPDLMEAAFQAGLLHDCAVPLLRRGVADYEYLAKDALAHGPEGIEMERACNGTDHATLGAALALAWGFSPAQAAAVRWHHSRSLAAGGLAEARPLLACLLLAKRVQAWNSAALRGFFPTPAEQSLAAEMAAVFVTTPRQLSEVMAELVSIYRLRQQHRDSR